MTEKPVNFRAITVILEHWILPLIFMSFAGKFLLEFLKIFFRMDYNPLNGLHLVRFALLFIFNATVAYFLYMTRNKTNVYPDQWSHIMIPILVTFWFLTYSLVEWIPETINKTFMVQPVNVGILSVGIFLCLLGQIVSLIGILDLKQSFGIVIKLNAVVTDGIYGLVRHPIYLGYCLMTLGFMLLTPRVIHWMVYLMAIVLQIWRAKIEEGMLANVSPEYRFYCKQVPFLFPQLGKLFSKS